MALSVGASLIVSMCGVESCLVADVSVRPGGHMCAHTHVLNQVEEQALESVMSGME